MPRSLPNHTHPLQPTYHLPSHPPLSHSACFAVKLTKHKEASSLEISKLKVRITSAELRAQSAEKAKLLAETRLIDAQLLGTAQREAAVGALRAEHGAALLASYMRRVHSLHNR